MLPKEDHRPVGLIARVGIQVLLVVGRWWRQGRVLCSCWALLFPSEQTWLAKLQQQCLAALACCRKIQANTGNCCQAEWKLLKRCMHMKHTSTSYCRVTCRAQHQGRPSVSCSVVLLLIFLWLFCVSSRQAIIFLWALWWRVPFLPSMALRLLLGPPSCTHSSGWLSWPSFRSPADVEKQLCSQDFPQCP